MIHKTHIEHSHDNVYKLVSTMRDAAGFEDSRWDGKEFVREEDAFFANSLLGMTHFNDTGTFLSKYFDDGK